MPERPGEQNFPENRIRHESALDVFKFEDVFVKIPTNGMKPWKARRLGGWTRKPGINPRLPNRIDECRGAMLPEATSANGGWREI